jgi:hypothetical protein
MFFKNVILKTFFICVLFKLIGLLNFNANNHPFLLLLFELNLNFKKSIWNWC